MIFYDSLRSMDQIEQRAQPFTQAQWTDVKEKEASLSGHLATEADTRCVTIYIQG